MKKSMMIMAVCIASCGSFYYIKSKFSIKGAAETVSHGISSTVETIGEGTASVLTTGRGQFGPVGVAFTFECAEAKNHWRYPSNANIPTLNKQYCQNGSNQPEIIALNAIFVSTVEHKLVPWLNALLRMKTAYPEHSANWNILNMVESFMLSAAKTMYQKGSGNDLTLVYSDTRSPFYINWNPPQLTAPIQRPTHSLKDIKNKWQNLSNLISGGSRPSFMEYINTLHGSLVYLKNSLNGLIVQSNQGKLQMSNFDRDAINAVIRQLDPAIEYSNIDPSKYTDLYE